MQLMNIVLMIDVKTRLRETTIIKLFKLAKMSGDHGGPAAELFGKKRGGVENAVGFYGVHFWLGDFLHHSGACVCQVFGNGD